MSGDSLWSRVRKARLVQILAVYLGVSWVLLQVVGELRDALELPAWIGPVSLILLVIGLFMVMATAWVQAHPVVAASVADAEAAGATAERGEARTADARAGESGADVPGSWSIALGDIKESLSRGEVPHLTWGRALIGGVFAFSVLFGLAGLYVVIQDRGESFAPAPVLAEAAAPGIAVLPFTVADPELEEWREGMVTILSTNLDGAGGLRAIDSRTVLARWDEHAGNDARADLQGSLQVAGAAGGRYALLGSAVSGGGGLRLNADVYDVRTGEALDRVTVEGPADSIFSLVDQLSIQVLQAILPDVEGEFEGVGLARVTTSSLPALRAFLEAEAHFRRGRFDAAIPAYERAIEADTGFALAAYRLSNAYGWAESIQSELSGEAIERAARHADRLPERERLLVLAERSLFQGTLEGIENLRLAVRRYPDDPEAWYLLGDTYIHLGPTALVPQEETEQAFLRAIELDPDFAPAHIHYIDMAFRLDPDSARARTRLDRYAELAGGTQTHDQMELAFDLAFGDETTRSAARAALDTTSAGLTTIGSTNLFHGRFGEGLAAVTEELVRRDHPFAPPFEAYSGLLRGRLREAEAAFTDAGYPAVARLADRALLRAWMDYLDLQVPDPPWVRQALAVAVVDTANSLHALAGGIYAVEAGLGAERDRAAATLRAAASRMAESDALSTAYASGGVSALEGAAAWRRGDREGARRLLDEARLRATASSYPGSVLNDHIRWWRALLEIEDGRPERASPYLESLWFDPVARLALGRTYDGLGEREKALEAYRYFITAWASPDPELEALVEEIRQRIAALMDAPADP